MCTEHLPPPIHGLQQPHPGVSVPRGKNCDRTVAEKRPRPHWAQRKNFTEQEHLTHQDTACSFPNPLHTPEPDTPLTSQHGTPNFPQPAHLPPLRQSQLRLLTVTANDKPLYIQPRFRLHQLTPPPFTLTEPFLDVQPQPTAYWRTSATCPAHRPHTGIS